MSELFYLLQRYGLNNLNYKNYYDLIYALIHEIKSEIINDKAGIESFGNSYIGLSNEDKTYLLDMLNILEEQYDY